jgi:hypothetical protein
LFRIGSIAWKLLKIYHVQLALATNKSLKFSLNTTVEESTAWKQSCAKKLLPWKWLERNFNEALLLLENFLPASTSAQRRKLRPLFDE